MQIYEYFNVLLPSDPLSLDLLLCRAHLDTLSLVHTPWLEDVSLNLTMQNVNPWSVALLSLESLLEMQIVRPYSRWSKSEYTA